MEISEKFVPLGGCLHSETVDLNSGVNTYILYLIHNHQLLWCESQVTPVLTKVF
jgi:hypothetical protein